MPGVRPLAVITVLLVGLLGLKALWLVDGVTALISSPAEAAETAQHGDESHDEPAQTADSHGAEVSEIPQPVEAQPSADPLANCPVSDPFADRVGATQSELEVLRRLSERRREIDQRAQALDTRESLLLATEQRVDERVVALRELRDEVQVLLGQLDERREQEVTRIVDLYGRMDPGQSAPILAALDEHTLLLVAERMATNKLAPIMAEMEPRFAAALTARLAQRSVPPDTAAELEARLEDSAG
ncbi:MotE family protein [Woodsholea maritima]|uniref:MotE family protein n=1 Tax=Woodsholea maritima TaxID=240237 RepID=UPI0003819789|nr:hypothetical protein [Woodsholea maritima]